MVHTASRSLSSVASFDSTTTPTIKLTITPILLDADTCK